MGAHILKADDRCFAFLCEFLAGQDEDGSPSPFAWTERLRTRARDWAEDCVNDDRQDFADPDSTGIHDDRRAVLRLAALAIAGELGTLLDKKPTVCVDNPWAIRSMMAWFWATREPVRMLARGAQMRGVKLSNVPSRRRTSNDHRPPNAAPRGQLLIARRAPGQQHRRSLDVTDPSSFATGTCARVRKTP